jgi:simple sugar transport system permease protein
MNGAGAGLSGVVSWGLVRSVFSVTMLAQTLRMSVPYACAALGGVWSERSGIVNIALEGMLLSSGLASVVVHHATGSAAAGVAGGVIVGAILGLVHASVARAKVDAIISGIALNLAAAGGTRFLLRALYDSSSNSPPIEGFRLGALEGSSGPRLLVRTLVDPLTLLTAGLAVGTVWLLYRTRFGLRVRACGEDPAAAASVGVPVHRVRLAAVALGAAICGVGGTALAYDQHQFQSGMSGGRGFIALAAVIVSGWRPTLAVVACMAFAALDALQIVLQDKTRGAHDLVGMLPYVATLVVLVVIGWRGSRASPDGRPPAALGKVF